MPLNLSLPTDWLRSEGVNLSQYFGLWAVEDQAFIQLLQHVQAINLVSHVRAGDFDGEVDARRAEAVIVSADEPLSEGSLDGQQVQDGSRTAQIAIISIRGTMTKMGSSLSTAGSTVRLRQAIRSAARSGDVDGILLLIDSPGGTVSGTADLAAEVARANEEKPVFAFIEDLGASAAYWVASQASKVYVNDDTALVGSIGTYLALYDMSGYAGQQGIKPIVIKAGELKGSGFPGTEITDAQKASWQEMIDKTQASFTAGVARGRGISEDAVPVTGKVYMAKDAIALGLADGVKSLDDTVQELAAAALKARSASSGISGRQIAAGSITTNLKAVMPEANSNIVTELVSEAIDTTEPAATSDELADLKAKLAAFEAKAAEDEQRLAELEGARRMVEFEAFAKEHRRRILATNAPACVAVMGALAAYDEMLAADNEASALDAFKAMVGSIPEQFSAGVEVTGDGKASEEEPVVSVPFGATVDLDRSAAAARVKRHAEEHNITFAEALAQLGDRALRE